MKQTPIIFRADRGEHHPVFCLRKLFVSDDSEYLQQYFGFADIDDKREAAYKIKAEAIAKWAIPWPDDAKLDGKKIKRPEDALDNADAISKFFAEGDADKDWISETIIGAMRVELKLTFFDGSQP